MVLVSATLVLSIVVTQSKFSRVRDEEVVRALTPFFAEHAARLFEEHGEAALSEYLATLPGGAGPHSYFFSEDGRELLGHAAPTETADAYQKARQTGETQIENGRGRHFVGQRATGPSGRHYVLLLYMRPPFLEFLQVNPTILIIRLTCVVLVVGLVCLWLARYITAPVTRLRAATRQLAEGNLGARVGSANAKRQDELAELGRDFDHMAEQIQSLMASQRRLISDISHELRSPLARLSVALGLAWRQANPEIEGSLEHIEREADRLNELIGVLLKLARLESDAEPVNRETIELKVLLREVTADADFEAQSRHATVRIVKSEPCSIIGIRSALRSALENVLRNAVNYTAEGTDVEVILERIPDSSQESAVIRVRDHGEGVPGEALESIFRPFYRVADARDRSSGGTGLGLTITERVVRLHGGQVKAHNSPDGGLVVELRLPLSRSQATDVTSPAISLPLQAD
jgi:two-component system sensor histidine kinase CpxA